MVRNGTDLVLDFYRYIGYLDTHGHQAGASHAAHGPEGVASLVVEKTKTECRSDVEIAVTPSNLFDHNLLTQVIGVAILEFGVVLHRYTILALIESYSRNSCPVS